MKLIKYILNEDGTIPEYVLDGGYYPSPNSNSAPQDITLIGIVEDSTPGEEINSLEDLKNYLISIGGQDWKDVENNPLDIDYLSEYLWNKL